MGKCDLCNGSGVIKNPFDMEFECFCKTPKRKKYKKRKKIDRLDVLFIVNEYVTLIDNTGEVYSDKKRINEMIDEIMKLINNT